jgi:hypothetical protein
LGWWRIKRGDIVVVVMSSAYGRMRPATIVPTPKKDRDGLYCPPRKEKNVTPSWREMPQRHRLSINGGDNFWKFEGSRFMKINKYFCKALCCVFVFSANICIAQNNDILNQLNNDTKYWLTIISYKHGVYDDDVIAKILPIIDSFEYSIIHGRETTDIRLFKDNRDIEAIREIAKQCNKSIESISGIVFDYELLKRSDRK